ncbi:MAG: hypothetical protein JNM66_22860 [Bryobacterales bacterium]|nr:hypothetical protein [Bryobacterales bacterium]
MHWLAVLLILAVLPTAAAEPDALAISANIQSRHLPFGTILDPFYASASSDQITGYTRCGDSAIWTGHYLAAESYRYRVTNSPEALNNARKAINGIKGLVDVTGSNLLARCRIAIGSPFAAGIHSEEASNGVFTNAAAGYTWIGNLSRDQYCGVIYGLGVAHDLLPPQPAIVDIVTRLVSFLLDNNWAAPAPNFSLRPDQRLAILQVARRVNPARFNAIYETQRERLISGINLPVLFDSLSTSSYFKFNLIYITFFHLIHGEETPAKAAYERTYAIARNYTAGHQNAFFNMIDAALFGPDSRRDAETRELLDLWLKRPRRDFFVDLRGKVRTCGDQACDPIPVDQRTPTDFLWQRSPFQLFGGFTGTIGNAGVDYILPYWMARYYGVIADFQLPSAVAPDSISSLYGAGLPRNAPLQLTAANGATFPLPVIFSSPAQYNFLVPPGVPPGRAIVTLDANKTASFTVQPTAPFLFTLTPRLAAATAIRVQNGLQIPVPVFDCAAVCVPAPIELSPAAPVYLTLYATGLRFQKQTTVTINSIASPVLYAGAQPSFPGLDQVNVELPAQLRGSGEVEIILTVDGRPANSVYITVR